MARLIDADALVQHINARLRRLENSHDNPLYKIAWQIIRDYIEDDTPTVDAVPVVHARWKRGRNGRTVCSACRHRLPTYACDNWETGEEWAEEIDKTPFCPNCGAKMDGDTP